MSIKISISEKYIGGKAHTLGICNDLVGGKRRIHSAFTRIHQEVPGNAPLLNPIDSGVFSGVPTLNRNPNEEFEQIYYFIIYLNQYNSDLDHS